MEIVGMTCSFDFDFFNSTLKVLFKHFVNAALNEGWNIPHKKQIKKLNMSVEILMKLILPQNYQNVFIYLFLNICMYIAVVFFKNVCVLKCNLVFSFKNFHLR